MHTPKSIRSTANPMVKKILQLQEKSKHRKKQKLLVVEGQREIELALQANYRIQSLLIHQDFLENDWWKNLGLHTDVEYIVLQKNVYQKLAYRGATEGAIAIFHAKDHTLEQVQWKRKNPIVLVAQAPEKPGNVGALLRTADAADIDLVIIADPKSDLYNPNTIRASIGCVFTNQIAIAPSHQAIDFLKTNRIQIFAAALQNSVAYYQSDFQQSTAIVVGTEATGLTDNWRNEAHQNIQIPMHGQIDSMNVSVAAAILLFEAKRQRNL
ncbi:MAG: RNA methyltransferase [Flavobacteriaceae bacterium]|nr:RNA methyltransferase [Flavobacteriaceae bacterium]